MFFVYVLQSTIAGSLYVGYTKDIKKRLREHNQGLNVSTKHDKPWKLVYFEACLNKLDATRRERYSKTTQGGRLLKRRLKEYFYEKRNIKTKISLQGR